MKREMTVVVALALAAGGAFATDMDHKAKTIKTVVTRHAGTAEVTCNAPGGWTFDVQASQDHRAALLKGGFRPHHAEHGYTWIESWSDTERILATYAGNQVLPVPPSGYVRMNP